MKEKKKGRVREGKRERQHKEGRKGKGGKGRFLKDQVIIVIKTHLQGRATAHLRHISYWVGFVWRFGLGDI